MRVRAYGTRGSSPVQRSGTVRYGGNTTCFRIFSDCIPKRGALIVDAGSGFVPASRDLLAERLTQVAVLMTHYHHDHTQGFPLAPVTYAKDTLVRVFGPKEHGVGPREMLETIMRAPFFPVDFVRVASHFDCVSMSNIGCDVLLVHPDEGALLVRLDDFERLLADGTCPGVPLSRKAIGDCLVVRMHKTAHPEYTVSFRFEERPTGKVLVFLTDHENTDSLPSELRAHIQGADLLIQDAQYLRGEYDGSRAGFGHGTGDYSARVMLETSVARLAHTHHDPLADDADVEAIVEESKAWLRAHGATELAEKVFAFADYQETEV